MYIFKYALLNLKASWIRNLLMGIMIIVISFSAFLALSIRQSAEATRKNGMDSLNVTANIRVDRAYIMKESQSKKNQSIDRSEAMKSLTGMQGMTLKEYKKYAKADAVKDFYYTETVYLNGNDKVLPIGHEEEEETTTANTNNQQMGPGGEAPPQMEQQGMEPEKMKTGEFKVVGCNSEGAMEDFVDGKKKITKGEMFNDDTKEYQCLISKNVATLNDLSVGDTITLCRPDVEKKKVKLKVAGFYSTQTDASYNTTQEDPDNEVYVNTKVLDTMVSDLNKKINTKKYEKMDPVVSGIYTFAKAKDYYAFEKQAKSLGLKDKYTIVSNDIALYESSLIPLNNLKKYALTLLLVVMIVGVVIIVFLNTLHINSRKKEIGTLAAVGMSKLKIITQYSIEVITVMIIALVIGTSVGAAVSTPVTNKLLESQVASQIEKTNNYESNFGREQMQPGSKPIGGDVEGEVNYVTTVSTTVNYVVILQLIGIALILGLFASMVSVIFILRCDPNKILTSSH